MKKRVGRLTVVLPAFLLACGGVEDDAEIEQAVEGDSSTDSPIPDCNGHYDADQYKLIGLVEGLDGPVAMLEDPTGKSCLLRPDSQLPWRPVIFNDPVNQLRWAGAVELGSRDSPHGTATIYIDTDYATDLASPDR